MPYASCIIQLIKGLVLVSTLTSSYLCHYNAPKFLKELRYLHPSLSLVLSLSLSSTLSLSRARARALFSSLPVCLPPSPPVPL